VRYIHRIRARVKNLVSHYSADILHHINIKDGARKLEPTTNSQALRPANAGRNRRRCRSSGVPKTHSSPNDRARPVERKDDIRKLYWEPTRQGCSGEKRMVTLVAGEFSSFRPDQSPLIKNQVVPNYSYRLKRNCISVSLAFNTVCKSHRKTSRLEQSIKRQVGASTLNRDNRVGLKMSTQ